MIRTLLLLPVAISIYAQDATVIRGEKVFQASCSVPYCHGPNGTAGRAPKLIGHGFAARDLYNTVFSGISDKGMPAFGGQLPVDDIRAVVSYVMSLKGSTPVSVAPKPAVALPGKALFFDAVRMGGCGRCHELEKRGSPVVELKTADVSAVEARRVMTAQPVGESAFPAFVTDRSEKRVRLFDLSSPLPVMRTFKPDAVKLTSGSTWQHRDAVSGYSDAELQEIAKYLQSVVSPH